MKQIFPGLTRQSSHKSLADNLAQLYPNIKQDELLSYIQNDNQNSQTLQRIKTQMNDFNNSTVLKNIYQLLEQQREGIFVKFEQYEVLQTVNIKAFQDQIGDLQQQIKNYENTNQSKFEAELLKLLDVENQEDCFLVIKKWKENIIDLENQQLDIISRSEVLSTENQRLKEILTEEKSQDGDLDINALNSISSSQKNIDDLSIEDELFDLKKQIKYYKNVQQEYLVKEAEYKTVENFQYRISQIINCSVYNDPEFIIQSLQTKILLLKQLQDILSEVQQLIQTDSSNLIINKITKLVNNNYDDLILLLSKHQIEDNLAVNLDKLLNYKDKEIETCVQKNQQLCLEVVSLEEEIKILTEFTTESSVFLHNISELLLCEEDEYQILQSAQQIMSNQFNLQEQINQLNQDKQINNQQSPILRQISELYATDLSDKELPLFMQQIKQKSDEKTNSNDKLIIANQNLQDEILSYQMLLKSGSQLEFIDELTKLQNNYKKSQDIIIQIQHCLNLSTEQDMLPQILNKVQNAQKAAYLDPINTALQTQFSTDQLLTFITQLQEENALQKHQAANLHAQIDENRSNLDNNIQQYNQFKYKLNEALNCDLSESQLLNLIKNSQERQIDLETKLQASERFLQQSNQDLNQHKQQLSAQKSLSANFESEINILKRNFSTLQEALVLKTADFEALTKIAACGAPEFGGSQERNFEGIQRLETGEAGQNTQNNKNMQPSQIDPQNAQNALNALNALNSQNFQNSQNTEISQNPQNTEISQPPQLSPNTLLMTQKIDFLTLSLKRKEETISNLDAHLVAICAALRRFPALNGAFYAQAHGIAQKLGNLSRSFAFLFRENALRAAQFGQRFACLRQRAESILAERDAQIQGNQRIQQELQFRLSACEAENRKLAKDAEQATSAVGAVRLNQRIRQLELENNDLRAMRTGDYEPVAGVFGAKVKSPELILRGKK